MRRQRSQGFECMLEWRAKLFCFKTKHQQLSPTKVEYINTEFLTKAITVDAKL
jgi:hypothetical protein